MNDISHKHTDNIIVDADEHFIIDTLTKSINCTTNKKLTLMQFDHNSERYSFDIDRIIDGHDLMDCDRVQIHFINIGSSREKHPGLYLVDDVHVMPTDENKITFTWLVSNDATSLAGVLSFLVSFECTDGDKILYRWSSSKSESIKITEGMDNDNTIMELYADELLTWQNYMQTEFIPDLVDECYIEREFATSEEVAAVFDISNPDGTTEMTLISREELNKYIENAVNNASIATLVGTDEKPINFATDMEVGKLYNITGKIYTSEILTIGLSNGENSLVYKSDDSTLHSWGFGFDYNTLVQGPSVEGYIRINDDGSIYSEASHTLTTVETINGSQFSKDIYAPTTSGTAGQILQSNGEDQAPTWIDLSTGGSGGIEQLVGTQEKPINFATDMEVGHLYSITGYVRLTGTPSTNTPILALRLDTNRVLLYGARALPYSLSVIHGFYTEVYFDAETGAYSTSYHGSTVTWLNGAMNGILAFYAPTTSGTNGQILQSNGSNKAPTWVDIPEINTDENTIGRDINGHLTAIGLKNEDGYYIKAQELIQALTIEEV